MNDLFGAPLEEPTVKVRLNSGHHVTEPNFSFTPNSIHAMFQSLDMNNDGLVCARDLNHWQTQYVAGKRTQTKFGSSHDADASPNVLYLDEVVAFLRICGATPSFNIVPRPNASIDLNKGGKRKNRVSFVDESSIPASCVQNDAFSDEGLAACLAHFPTLAFDWSAPLKNDNRNNFTSTRSSSNHRNHAQGTSFNREKAASWFCRIDSNSDGWITAADLRLWRRMLPLGRSEDKLVLCFFPVNANANEAAAEALSSKAQPPKVSMRRRNSPFTPMVETQTQRHGSAEVKNHPDISPGLKPWEFYMVLRVDPMLTAELSAQVALLDFIMTGGHNDDNGAGTFDNRTFDGSMSPSGAGDGGDFIADLEIRDIDHVKGSAVRLEHTANDVPSDTMVNAFACVAKLKLCRLANAYREANAQVNWMAASVLYALDTTRCGYVSVHDLLKYLQRHANLYSVDMEDMCFLVDDNCNIGDGASSDVTESGFADFGKMLDQEALRNMLGRPAFGKFARLLCQFVQIQHELRGRQQQAMKTRQSKAGEDSLTVGVSSDVSPTQPPNQLTMKDRVAERHAVLLGKKHFLRESDCITATSSVASTEDHKRVGSTATRTTEVEQAERIAVESKQKSPRGFGQVALQKWFKELDVDGDGLITCRDLRKWCAAASCHGLVDEADLESLFHPSLPDFSSSTIQALHESTGDVTSTVAEVTRERSRPSTTTTAPHGDFGDSLGADHGDRKFNARSSPVKTTGSPVSGSLNEFELAVALARRPLLAAQLVLVRRVSRAMQLMLLAEACSSGALTAAATAATAADWAASAPSDRNQRAHVVAGTANSAAQQAAARARSAIADVVASCAPGGRYRMKNSGKDDDAAARKIEARIEEAEASDPQGIAARAARRSLQDHFLMEARQSVTRLSIEVALEIKLLAWREAEHYPDHLQQLRALLPLSTVSTIPLSTAKKAFGETYAAAEIHATKANTKAKKHMVSARKSNSKGTSNTNFLAGRSGNFNRMVLSLDDDEIGMENGATAQNEVSKTECRSIHHTPLGSSLDQINESRVSARHRKMTRTRKPLPKPQPRKRDQKPSQPSTAACGVNTGPIPLDHTVISISMDSSAPSSSFSSPEESEYECDYDAIL